MKGGRLRIAVILFFSGAVGLGLSFYVDRHRATERWEMETFHSPATFVRQLAGEKEVGRKVFQAFCATCHAKTPQIDVDAPRIGDPKAWSVLRGVGRAALLEVTLHGAGAMPARGGCFECSDAQIQQAIDYILQNSL